LVLTYSAMMYILKSGNYQSSQDSRWVFDQKIVKNGRFLGIFIDETLGHSRMEAVFETERCFLKKIVKIAF